MSRWPTWLGLAVLLGGAACVFQPDLSRFPACDAAGACPTGSTCLASEGVCLPDCGERGPCVPETPEPDAGTPPALALVPDAPPVGLELASYLHRFQASGGTPPHAFSFIGELPPGLSLTAQGELSGKPTAAGDFRFTLEVVDQGPTPQLTRQERSVRIRPLLRLAGPGILADVPSETAYVEQLSATGGTPPYRFELVSGSALPAGILLRDAGRVDGMTSQAGTVAFEVRVSDNGEPQQVVTRTLQLTTGSCPSLTLCMRTRAVPDARVGTAYTYAFQISGGTNTLTWRATGTLPPGLTLGSTGVLSGTPTQAGSYPFTVTVEDVFDKPQVAVTLTVH
ncbi:Ig domain-containing protein [Archangium sp.]|uniref:Ig domain-containing protein n=1 Tax=Archangium sp. TaxID=1872627 RepID=UPI00286A4CB0|nr:Ig domain-containing protein [Archangium sp.]